MRQQAFETYTTDQFILRDSWVDLNTSSEIALGKQDNGRVYFGKSGWRFSIPKAIDQTKKELNLEALNRFVTRYPNTRIVPVPSKSTVVRDKLPAFAPIIDETALFNALGTHTVNVLPAYASLIPSELYYKTDHHWTTFGAYKVYEFLFPQDNVSPDAFTKQEVTHTFFGSDIRKGSTPWSTPDTITAYTTPQLLETSITVDGQKLPLFDDSKLESSDPYGYFLGGNHAIATIKGTIQNGRSLVLIKDSFANAMIPFLLNHYKHITVVDLRYFNGSVEALMTQTKPTDIMVMMQTQTLLQDVTIQRIDQ